MSPKLLVTAVLAILLSAPPNPPQISFFGSKPAAHVATSPDYPSGFVARRCLGNTPIGSRPIQIRKERSWVRQ
jgi:hypothetical protein